MHVFGFLHAMASMWNVLSAVSKHGKRVFLNLNPAILFLKIHAYDSFKKIPLIYFKWESVFILTEYN